MKHFLVFQNILHWSVDQPRADVLKTVYCVCAEVLWSLAVASADCAAHCLMHCLLCNFDFENMPVSAKRWPVESPDATLFSLSLSLCLICVCPHANLCTRLRASLLLIQVESCHILLIGIDRLICAVESHLFVSLCVLPHFPRCTWMNLDTSQ